jgi:DNA polymerase III subunit epsilon
MKLALFYDTETTGLPLYGEPSEDPQQPHIVQLAACLVNLDTHKTVSSIDFVIKPDGFEILPEVTAIHGITTEYANICGISEAVAIVALFSMWQQATVRIGHNEPFDARIMRIAQARHGIDEISMRCWKEGTSECTMKLARPHTALEKNKNPKLSEAYRHFMGKELDSAHTAMADVLGCMSVYFAIKNGF